MIPTISRLHEGLQIEGLPGGPHYIRPPETKSLVLGLQQAPLINLDREVDGVAFASDDGRIVFRPGPDDSQGYWTVPAGALKALVLGVLQAPIDLDPSHAPERATAATEAGV
jgi:hypothetical protein